jgi:long-chain fatty acid transport protein
MEEGLLDFAPGGNDPSKGLRAGCLACLWLLALCIHGPALANNGLNMIAFSAEGVGMGGADVPVARDALSLSVNPAGLSQLERRQFEGVNALAYVDASHSDRYSNGSKKSANNIIGISNLGFAQPFAAGKFTLGAGLFVQGGSGPVYNNLDTAFGTRDELSSVFRIAKGSVALSYRVTDTLSLGIAPTLFYGDLNQRIFPDTSFVDTGDPANNFFGLKVNGASGVAPGVRFGALYRPIEHVSIGAAYATQSSLDLKDGNVVANFDALGLGKVKYRDAKVEGFSLPREASLGVAVQATETLLVAVEGTWIDWSSALGSSWIKAKNPDNPAAPSMLDIRNELNWRDQYVIAVGLAYEPEPEWILRAGYNYANNPIPKKNLSPLLGTITQHHATLGAGYHPGNHWMFDAALEYDVPAEVNYSNQSAPFTQDARQKLSTLALWLSVSYRW